MVETAASIASIVDVVLQVAAPIGSPFMYFYNYNTNFKKLREEVRKLENAKRELEYKIDATNKNLEETKQNVKDWQNKVDKIIREVEELIEKNANNLEREVGRPNISREELEHENANPGEASKITEQKAKKQCFMRFCPHIKARYKDSKEASRKVTTIEELLKEAEGFNEVSHPRRLPDLRLTPDKGFQDFDSRKGIEYKILEALRNPNVNMVGISGMGGVGKTTLAKAVSREVIEEKTLFDAVVFVEITETPDIKKIQDEIAHQLGLKLTDEPRSERIKKVYARLKNNKRNDKENDKKNKGDKDEENDKESDKILLILDNIWEDSVLKKIGIPSKADLGESKLLLTARERSILESMVCELFQIDKLREDEAWELFKTMTGDFIEERELKSLAQEVCTKCGGLPITIITIAKALSNRTNPSEWSAALEKLQSSSPENFEGDLEQSYLSIELSYNYLRGEELKKTFLLCSLMGHEASILDLLKYVVGLNILKAFTRFKRHEIEHTHLYVKSKTLVCCLMVPLANHF